MSLTFRKSDFENIKYSIIFINQTSGTEFRNFENLKLLEIGEKSVVVKVPTNSCQVNHNAMVCFFKGENPKIPKNISIDGKNKEILFAGIGKIKSKNIIEENEEYCEVLMEFTQYDKRVWNRIVGELKNRQASIVNLFEKIRFHEEE